MSLTHYEAELEKLERTYATAMALDVSPIKNAIAGASESSLIGVGSGGSFTVASLLCNFHETYTGRISRPSTPLEIICNPTLAAASPVFMISAEGKNPDIIEALRRARRHSARPVHVLTNRSASALTDCAGRLLDVTTHIFELSDKDGYLATNSLLLDAVLIARAYGELDNDKGQVPGTIEDLRLDDQTTHEWLRSSTAFVEEASRRGTLITTFSPLLKPVAADLESKLSESALLNCQLSDLRSFAHGRHLWLADRAGDCAILALVDSSLMGLWKSMETHLPKDIPTLMMPFGGAKPRDLLAGLVAQMYLVAAIAKCKGKDPGRPFVPKFGRDIHYIDLPRIIPLPADLEDEAERSKYEVLGAHWPAVGRIAPMRRAKECFTSAIERQEFRAIVFDYDGVLCSSQRKDSPPPENVMERLRELIQEEVIVGVASGRGGSIQEAFHANLPEQMRSKIQLGLYNGGCILDASSPPEEGETSEFLSNVTRVMRNLQEIGVPIEHIRTTHPYQVSVRFREGVGAHSNWLVIADALRQAGLEYSKAVRSKHSVDILGTGISKSRLVAHIVQNFKIDPYQVLTIGDQGAWPGNDCSLLEHRYSLSVDEPSRRLDRGWKLAPAHKRNVDATLWYLERIHLTEKGKFTLELSLPKGGSA